MGRRRTSGLDMLAELPWPVGIAAGVVGYVAVRHGFTWWMSRTGGPLTQGLAQQGAALAPLAWLLLGVCWMAALVSFVRGRHRRRLLDMRSTLDSLAAGGWRQFEQLVGEAFRRQGYQVEETGLGGADGGIDLILRKNGRRTLVQCKQWKRQQVGVSTVREMAGLLAHHRADAVKIVCVGKYTPDAEAFARGKPIDLIGGERLLEIIRAVQSAPAAAPFVAAAAVPPHAPQPLRSSSEESAPACPLCGAQMVQRANRTTGEHFWGCRQFPKCRGVRKIG